LVLISGNASALRRRTLLSGTMLVAATVGYGRRAYAACVNSGGSTYQCSGANLSPQTITGNNASVSTVAGFSVNTAAGSALKISGRGALSYIDTNASPLTAPAGNALDVRSLGDFAGTPGSVTISTDGALSGFGYGIFVLNSGAGALTITANGDVASTLDSGIFARNISGASTTLSVTTGVGTTVSGGSYGIVARNSGSGALTITANGNVTGAGHDGIYAVNSGNGTDVTVITGAGTTVSGSNNGIHALGVGTGALTVTANGDVTGTAINGIYAKDIGPGTTLSVTTAAGTTVSGATGIFASHYGTGALTITANGNVTGTAGNGGIYAQNSVNGTDISVTTGAGTTVSGTTGILARHYGTGAVAITANGNVTGTTSAGILAYNNVGTTITVTTGAGTTVNGATSGIFARNYGSGGVTITVNGNVTGNSATGIYGRASNAAPIAVTVGATGSVTSHGATANDFAIDLDAFSTTVTVAGTVNGGAGGAIRLPFSSTSNRLELVTGAVINGNVLGGLGIDTLGLSGSGSGSFNVAQLSSFEAGQKTGTGSWTLTGANTGITAFSVGAGTLFVNGGLGNAAFTVSGGTLGGIGTVGNTLINAGGTFAPGSGTPGSFMTVNGTLGLNATSTYAVNLNPATASSANVSGMATLGSATVNAIFAPGSYIAKQYVILTAGSIGGTFGTLSSSNKPASIADALSYDGTHAYLNLTLNFHTPGGLNGNQQAVANALTNFFNSTGGIPAAFASLNANGLTQASGESATGSQQTTFNAMNQFMGVLTDPFIDGRGDGPGTGGGAAATGYASTQKPAAIRDAYAMFTKAAPAVIPFEQRWSVWAAGYGGSQTTDGNAASGSNTATSSIAGTAVGADYRISPNTLAGFALAGGGTSFSVANAGSGRSDLFQAGAFVRHNVGPAYISAALAYGWQDVTTNRTVTIAGTDMLRAEFNANAFSGRLESGYRFVAPVMGGLGITPYAAAQFTTFDLPAYAERALAGANTFALAYGARDVTDSRSELGLRTDKSFAMPDGILTLRGRLAWAHDYDPDRSIGATFQTLPGASFVVNGAAQAADSALVTAAVEKKWLTGWSAAATFEGEFSDVTRSYAGKGVVRYQW
jgi:uncharacterized protein with beta-barrel porin domain